MGQEQIEDFWESPILIINKIWIWDHPNRYCIRIVYYMNPVYVVCSRPSRTKLYCTVPMKNIYCISAGTSSLHYISSSNKTHGINGQNGSYMRTYILFNHRTRDICLFCYFNICDRFNFTIGKSSIWWHA